MALDKAIKSGKEKRAPYRKSKAFDRTCCNHGSCSYCEGNRLHSGKKSEEATKGQEDEFFGYWFYPDPSDVEMERYDDRLKEIGIDPWDFETRRELNI